ncbi:hypothetical protein ACU686_30030, partial [Yinghuangia aomiensis]
MIVIDDLDLRPDETVLAIAPECVFPRIGALPAPPRRNPAPAVRPSRRTVPGRIPVPRDHAGRAAAGCGVRPAEARSPDANSTTRNWHRP